MQSCITKKILPADPIRKRRWRRVGRPLPYHLDCIGHILRLAGPLHNMGLARIPSRGAEWLFMLCKLKMRPAAVEARVDDSEALLVICCVT